MRLPFLSLCAGALQGGGGGGDRLSPPGNARQRCLHMLPQSVQTGGSLLLPPLSPQNFTVDVVPSDGDGAFTVQLLHRCADGRTVIAPPVLQHSKDFVQLNHLVRAVAPKFDAPPPPVAQNCPREKLLQHVCDYLNAAIAFDPLSSLKELQDFVGYTEMCQLKRRAVAELDHTSTTLRHVSPHVLPGIAQQPPERRSSLPGGYDRDDDENGGGGGGVQLQRSSNLHPEEVRMLEECFRIMDVGVAGYITLEDVKEFFSCGEAGEWIVMQLRRDEPCNCERFVAIVQAALRSGKIMRILEEWIDGYWLLQYRKIFTALGVLVNSELDHLELSSELTHGFHPFELASLMFVLTEAGLRLVSFKEVEEWVCIGKHRRSCALTMEQLVVGLDTLSKVVPFSEVWLALMPHPDSRRKILHTISKYAAVADAVMVEELQEQIIQMRQTTMPEEDCGNCGLLREALLQQERLLVEARAANADLTARVQYLEQRLGERTEAVAQLQRDHLHAQTLLGEAEIREAELVEALEERKQQELLSAGVNGGDCLDASAANTVSTKCSPSLLQLMPCGNAVPHASAGGGGVSLASRPFLFSTAGAVAYAIPSSLSLPFELSVDVFWCDATPDGANKTERLVCRDAAGQRSCVVIFRSGELHVVAGETEGKRNYGGHLFRLAARYWYHLRCLFDWQKRTFCVTLTQCGGDGGRRGTMAMANTRKNVDVDLCGPFSMVDEQTSGVAIVDIFPRTQLLVSYCNFFLHYTR